MSSCSTSEALELLLKGTVTRNIIETLQARLVLGRVKVVDPFLRMDLQAEETMLVRVGRLKLQRWVIQ